MTKEQLFELMKKEFNDEQLQENKLILEKIYPLDMVEFICDIENMTGKVIKTERLIPDNFRDLESIYTLISEGRELSQ